MAKKTEYTAIGRRKRSVAKVTITPGKGIITVNGKDVKDYMPYETLVMDLVQPLELVDSKDKFDKVKNQNATKRKSGEEVMDFIQANDPFSHNKGKALRRYDSAMNKINSMD